jgi:RNA polymerase sigma-70 factor (ECF subfamily)
MGKRLGMAILQAMPQPMNLIPTRESLLSRLRDWADDESWSEFFHTYWRMLYEVALRAGLREDEAQEAVQETVIAVAKKMPGFHYDPTIGSFKGWLLQIARRRIVDQFRKRNAGTGTDQRSSIETLSPAELESLSDPVGCDLEAIWDEEWEKSVLAAAIERVKRRVSPEQYQLYDLYVFQRWPVTKVARELGVSLGRVYLAKHRIGRLLKKEVTRQAAIAELTR